MTEHDSQKTTDHATIRQWAEARGGKPASVEGTGGDDDDPGILRIQFADGVDQDLAPISWDEFFEKFEDSDLAFLYQDRTTDGQTSRFFKFVQR